MGGYTKIPKADWCKDPALLAPSRWSRLDRPVVHIRRPLLMLHTGKKSGRDVVTKEIWGASLRVLSATFDPEIKEFEFYAFDDVWVSVSETTPIALACGSFRLQSELNELEYFAPVDVIWVSFQINLVDLDFLIDWARHHYLADVTYDVRTKTFRLEQQRFEQPRVLKL